MVPNLARILQLKQFNNQVFKRAWVVQRIDQAFLNHFEFKGPRCFKRMRTLKYLFEHL